MLCTNDGQFTHEIISPKKKLEKEYYLELALPISDEDIAKLESGIALEDGYVTMPAQAQRAAENALRLTIHE